MKKNYNKKAYFLQFQLTLNYSKVKYIFKKNKDINTSFCAYTKD